MGRMTTIMVLVACSTLAAGLLVACGDDEPAATQGCGGVNHPLPGDPVAGAAIYKRICIACHAADGRGNGGLTGGDFVGDPTRLAKSNAELLHTIAEGRPSATPPMPAQKDVLSEQEMKDALSYIRREFGGTRQ